MDYTQGDRSDWNNSKSGVEKRLQDNTFFGVNLTPVMWLKSEMHTFAWFLHIFVVVVLV